MLLLVWLILVFILGAAVGSGLNVAIVRIPAEKSILWPSSHCGKCFQPVKWYHNLPLISYWWLRGRCRSCGATFSIRYFFVELFTGLAFAGLFYLDIVVNVHGIPRFDPKANWDIQFGLIPLQAWLYWAGHAVLVAFLIVTACTDLEHMEIPMPVTVTGMLFGLALSACFPWPWPRPSTDAALALPPELGWPPGMRGLVLGWQPWPLWHPDELPSWLAPGSWRLGLATGLAGVLAGMLILRAVRFLFGLGRGIEGLGLGDADVMMMAGAFVGWQIVLIAFFVSVFPALVLGLGRMILFRDQHLPFGPSLALGVLLTLLGWRWIAQQPFAALFFDRTLLIVLAVSGAFFLLVTSFILRLVVGHRDTGEPGASAPGGSPPPGADAPGSPGDRQT